MARTFQSYKMFVCVHKHYTVEDWIQFANTNPDALEVCVCVCVISGP